MRARRNDRGFTLPELMVSLVAGLIVTMSVVGLAKTATTTFHEQVRSTASEMSLRLAAQRLAGDLGRASFMSTGNIRWDTGISRLRTAPLPATGSRYVELNNLAGLRLYVKGSAEAGNFALENDNGLAPQAIDITGNFTSNDQYLGVIPTTPPLPNVACGLQSMQLNNDDPAVMRIMRTSDGVSARPDAEAQTVLQSIFLPVAGHTFPARVVDPSGRTHFFIVNGATVTGGQATISFAAAPDGSCPVLSGTQTGSVGGWDGLEQLQIAPIQTVRWSIQKLAANPRLDPPIDAAIKYDLVRQYINATGVAVGTPEIVSEYAVDLKFAFSVDQSPALPLSTSFDFEDEANNVKWSTTGVSTSARLTLADPAPHRIRSVRFRIATRTAIPDRTQDLPGPAPGYLLRYCLDGPPSATCLRYARVRTLMSEVALINQARMTY